MEIVSAKRFERIEGHFSRHRPALIKVDGAGDASSEGVAKQRLIQLHSYLPVKAPLQLRDVIRDAHWPAPPPQPGSMAP
ncbi:TPA: hypothetical protein NJT28_000330 [Corynebacterium striatum]|nr:hypothetical protein [Corynebacterium striatum]